jgi:hypothetical protein
MNDDHDNEITDKQMSNLKYKVKDPFCDGFVNITHITEGIWSIHSDDEKCESCIRFIIRISPVMDTFTDQEIVEWLETMTNAKENSE